MKKHIVIALAVVSIILGFVISCEEPQVNLPTQYTTPTIKGTLSIPTSQNVSASEVFVKVIDSDGNTVKVQKANADGSFVVQNLNAGKKYSVLFTSVEPEFTNRAVGGSSGVGGWLYDVVPAVQEGNNVGNVKLKPLGTIKGNALIDGESEHYDITVYIPGTSYIAKTDKDGSFSIYNVPEGKYTLRYTLDDHLPVMVKDVMLVCPEDVEKPEVKVKKVTLKSSLGSVEGRAILGDSNDSTGVKVNLESEDKSLTYPAFTSKDGYYTISGIQPGMYRVIVSYEGYTSQMSSYFSVTSGTLTKIDTLIELYSTSGFLKGSVSLNDSDTKSDIAVTIRNKEDGNTFTVMTDVNGDFSKRLKPGTYTVDFSHSGYSSYSVEATVVENNTTTLSSVTLYSVYGTIAGRSFSPEETVTLIDKNGNPIQTLQSSNDCTFKFSGIKSGTYSIRFSKTGFSSNTISDVVVTPSKTTTINGVELKSLYGTLKGVAGSEGDSVSLMKGGVVVETVTVDSSRRYSFTGIEPGSYSVRFGREGYAPYESETVAVAAASETTIDGKVLISIYGTISGKSGSEGETVSLIKDGTVLKTVVTTEDRSYSFTSVDPGIYKIRFSKDGYTSYESEEVTVLAGIESTVNGKALVSIYGTIKGISASEGETVYLVRNGVQIQSATTLESRGYLFSEIEPGEYSVRFTKNGYKTYESEAITVKAGESYVVDGQKLVSMYGAVAGFVFLSGSDDYSGVTVTLTSNESMTSSFVETTASDGSFRFSDIRESGTYLLTYSKEGYVTDNTKSVEVTVGNVSSAGAVTLKSTVATVKGNVQLEGATSYENITILLKNEGTQYTATTDQKGGYIINRVLPGTYILYASKDGYVSAQSNEIVVEPSSDKEVELLSLSVAIKSVTGSVDLELASDYSGVLVTATNLNDNTLIYSAITNSSGDFTLAGMKSGEYSIVLSCNGYNTITLPTINVVNTTVYNLDKQSLVIARGKIAGLVKLEGYTDHSGVKVSILGTAYTSYSNADGSFEFNVPAANYPGGLRFEKEDMETTAYAETVPVLVNSTYALKHEIEMKTVNVPVVSGTVKVGGTDNWEGVTVTIVEKPEFSFTTGEDGSWQFEHVPLGKYTLEYTRENAKKITSVLDVTAGPVITAPTLTIIPDSASIEGHISLASVSDYSGVRVSVKTSGVSSPLSTTTDSTGYFYIGNLLSSGTHTVFIEKAGWSSVTRELSNLEPLSVTDITADDTVVLIDTTAPSLNSVSINSGANATGSRKVNISVNAEDEGSGITLMQYSWTDNFDASSWLNYASSFDVTIPDEVNGTKTLKLRVKDNAGNVSSIASDSIDLVGQIQSIGGTLSVDDLHWVKENNPYVVTSDLIIPEGRTLVIDPGVDVLFDGNYSILIRGTLSAVGTENDPIVFRSTRDYMTEEYYDESYSGYNGNWGGISAGTNSFSVNTDSYDFELNYGSEMSYCNIQDIGTGIRGNIYVSNCIVISDRYAIGDDENRFTGALLNSRITGSAFLGEYSIIFGNEFTANDVSFIVPSHAYYYPSGNYYEWYNAQGRYEYYYVNEQRYYGYDEQGKSFSVYYNILQNNNCRTFINNKITGYLFYLNIWDSINKIQFITFEDCKFITGNGNSIWEYCEFINNQGTLEFSNFRGIRFSNFTGNTNRYLLKTNSRYTERSTHDMRFNYWDSANTRHLDSISTSSNPNVDFFYDGIDNIDLSVIDYSGYVSSPWTMAGYHGDKFCDVQATYVKQGEYEEAKVRSNIDIDLELLTDGSISYYRVAQSLDELISSGWIPYYGSACFLGSYVDYGKLEDGYLGLYLQVKTSEGIESPVKSLRVGYDIPVITSLSIKDGEVINKDNKISIQLTSSNAGGWYYIEFYVDDKYETYLHTWSGDNEVSNVIDPVMLLNGEHKLSIKLRDQFGDSSETVLNFTVDRPLPVVTDLSLENEILAKDEVLSLSVSATNTKHLKQIRIYMDGVQIGYQDYEDNGSSTVIEEFSVEPQYLKDGTHSLYVVLEDYTGNITTSDSVSVTVDSDNSTPPTISFTGLNDGTVFTNNNVESYSMTVSDEGGVSSVDIVLDGVTSLYHFSDQVYRDAYKNLDVKWRLRVPYYKNGDHTVTITATDFAGNKSEEVISFSVSRILPEISLDHFYDYSGYTYCSYTITPNRSWVYDGGLYIDGVLYYYNFINAGETSENGLCGFDIYWNRLREGSHTAQYKAKLQSGEIIESDTFIVKGTIPSSSDVFKEGVTWNTDGSLKNDQYTYYLWNFDSSDITKELVTGKSLGSVSDTVSGFGKSAARMDLDLSDMKIQFPNSSWTLEFWYKNNNAETESSSYIRLKNICNADINKRSSSTSSYVYTHYYYQDMNSNVGDIGFDLDFSRNDASSWHHYALVSDGSSLMVYIDGMMRYKTDGDKPSVKISDGLYISLPDKVYIDELRISNKARSADELWAYNEFVRERNLIPQ